MTAEDPLQKQVMQGDLTTDGTTTTSTGAKYDEWLAKQKDKPKPSPPTTDVNRNDFFEKARLVREEKMKGVVDAPPAPPEERPQGLNYREEARRATLGTRIRVEQEFLDSVKDKLPDFKVDEIQKEIDGVKTEFNNVGKSDSEKKLPFIPMGKNSHTKSIGGFVYGKTKVKIQKAVSGDEPLMIMLRERAKSVWNNLPDADRDLVETLNIKKSTKRKSGGNIRNGSWNPESKSLNINLQGSGVERTFYHELGHSKWTEMKAKNPEKVKKFTETFKEIGIAPTKYSESWKGRARKVERSFMEKQMRIERTRSLTPEEREIIRISNVRAKDIYENESHAELNAYAMGYMEKKRIIVRDETMVKLLNAYKEMNDL